MKPTGRIAGTPPGWHSVRVVGTRSKVEVRGASGQAQCAPKGEFVSGELAADCARFLADTRLRVERRRAVETRAVAHLERWRAAD